MHSSGVIRPLLEGSVLVYIASVFPAPALHFDSTFTMQTNTVVSYLCLAVPLSLPSSDIDFPLQPSKYPGGCGYNGHQGRILIPTNCSESTVRPPARPAHEQNNSTACKEAKAMPQRSDHTQGEPMLNCHSPLPLVI